jgi:hypothetical protein
MGASQVISPTAEPAGSDRAYPQARRTAARGNASGAVQCQPFRHAKWLTLPSRPNAGF